MNSNFLWEARSFIAPSASLIHSIQSSVSSSKAQSQSISAQQRKSSSHAVSRSKRTHRWIQNHSNNSVESQSFQRHCHIHPRQLRCCCCYWIAAWQAHQFAWMFRDLRESLRTIWRLRERSLQHCRCRRKRWLWHSWEWFEWFQSTAWDVPFRYKLTSRALIPLWVIVSSQPSWASHRIHFCWRARSSWLRSKRESQSASVAPHPCRPLSPMSLRTHHIRRSRCRILPIPSEIILYVKLHVNEYHPKRRRRSFQIESLSHQSNKKQLRRCDELHEGRIRLTQPIQVDERDEQARGSLLTNLRDVFHREMREWEIMMDVGEDFRAIFGSGIRYHSIGIRWAEIEWLFDAAEELLVTQGHRLELNIGRERVTQYMYMAI